MHQESFDLSWSSTSTAYSGQKKHFCFWFPIFSWPDFGIGWIIQCLIRLTNEPVLSNQQGGWRNFLYQSFSKFYFHKIKIPNYLTRSYNVPVSLKSEIFCSCFYRCPASLSEDICYLFYLLVAWSLLSSLLFTQQTRQEISTLIPSYCLVTDSDKVIGGLNLKLFKWNPI